MSTAIAMAPSAAPHDHNGYVEIAPSNAAPSKNSPREQRISVSGSSNGEGQAQSQRVESRSPKDAANSKTSPSGLRNGHQQPKVFVKKEPASPDLPTSRHRPRKLDLSKNNASAATSTGKSGGPLTSRESGGLGIQDVGLACLSPGFITQDPAVREQLQRSISVREQQRQIIEARLQQTAKPGDGQDSAKDGSMPGPSAFPMKTPATSRRKAPPGLSIVAPSHEQFAHERVIQSAPLNQTFTGRYQPLPLTRHIQHQPSNLSSTSHMHQIPGSHPANRLPPISDVFAGEGLGQHREAQRAGFYTNPSANNSSHSNTRPGYPSPVQSGQGPQSARPREYRSAEEAQVELAGGRPELMPKLVHYSSHGQPQSPPSPGPRTAHPVSNGEMRINGLPTARRRGREEYEEGRSPPLGPAPSARRANGPFGEARESPETNARKKERFIALISEAWDLWHA